jgi:hypothetical protein
MEKESFKKRFPNLAKEIEEGKGKADIEFNIEAPQSLRKFASYNPSVIDFIRRCSTDDQATEIIEYMLRRNEITSEEAKALSSQLEKKGLRSFGRKKQPGFYERGS